MDDTQAVALPQTRTLPRARERERERFPVPLPPPRPRVVPTNGWAACSLTLGLLAFPTLGVLGMPAILCGMIARETTATGRTAGNGMACVGMLLGWLWMAVWAVTVFGILLGWSLPGVP